jgi:hypothetical protein
MRLLLLTVESGTVEHIQIGNVALCCVDFMNPTGVVVCVQRQRLSLSIRPTTHVSTWTLRQHPVLEKSCFKQKKDNE